MNQKIIGYTLLGFSIVLILILIFLKVGIDKQSAYICEVHDTLGQEKCPTHESNMSWVVLISFIIPLVILGIGLYLLFPHKTEAKIEFKEIDSSKLDDEEKKIYDLLKLKEGSLYQTDLVKETGFSKVKTTRILDKMELKGILERKRRGMTNIIVLK